MFEGRAEHLRRLDVAQPFPLVSFRGILLPRTFPLLKLTPLAERSLILKVNARTAQHLPSECVSWRDHPISSPLLRSYQQVTISLKKKSLLALDSLEEETLMSTADEIHLEAWANQELEVRDPFRSTHDPTAFLDSK